MAWSGDLHSDSGSTTIVLDCAKTVTAIFSPIWYGLVTSTEPVDGGKINVNIPPSSPEGYLAGIEVTISAATNKGYQFSHWSGDATGSENQVTITMDSDKQLTAHYDTKSTFAWWWLAAGIGAIIIILPMYLRFIRKQAASG